VIAGFEFGSRAPLHVRHEHVDVLAATTAAWRLVYASDLHLTARRLHIGTALVDVVARQPCDAVLLGGDLLDRRSGAEALTATVRQLSAHAPVFGVAGNHDGRLGQDVARSAVRAAGGHWLHDAEGELLREGARLQLHAAVRPRTVREGSSVRVLVGHHPAIVEAAAPHYDIVLSGHLHGGQCVWWQRSGRLYPGAWFSRWNGLRFPVGGAVLLVSRGAADTLPVRFRCPREVLCCEIGEASKARPRVCRRPSAE
jgi:predicted MPP superfamily phosphohydrolase